MEKLPGAVEAKKKVDRIIDLCGPAPKVFFQKVFFKVKTFEPLQGVVKTKAPLKLEFLLTPLMP